MPDENLNCDEFLDFETCSSCIENYILHNSVCMAIPVSSLDDNCIEYNPETPEHECLFCDTDMFINSTVSAC